MSLIILAFIAGFLTILAPCIFPLIPVIIAPSLSKDSRYKPYFILFGLILSITVFSILLKGTTLLIDVDPVIWKIISGVLLIAFGFYYLFPTLWEKFEEYFTLNSKSNQLLNQAESKGGYLGDILLGAALGPVFTSCSPTYALILASIVPVNFWFALLLIVIYAIGLALAFLLIILFGRKAINKLKFASNPNGVFKKVLGIIFITFGLIVMFGFDKTIETWFVTTVGFDVTIIEKSVKKLFNL